MIVRTVTEWIRHHMMAPVWTLDEIDEGVRASMSPDFDLARRDVAGDMVLGIRAPGFRRARIARLRVGHLRYARCGAYLRPIVPSIQARLRDYDAGGNQEHLVDVVNLLDLEWIRSTIGEGTYWSAGVVPECDLYDARCLVDHYTICRNRVYLALAANATEFEYFMPSHPEAHFASDDSGGHASLRDSL